MFPPLMWQAEFTELLKSEFEKRKTFDTSFSLNKFAKMAGVSPSTMSELFSGRRDWTLSEERAVEMLSQIPMSETARNRMLVTLGKTPRAETVGLEPFQFDFFLNWKHQAVLLALDLPLEQRSEFILQQRFELSATELVEILEQARKMGLVEIDGSGNYQRQKKFWQTLDNIPNKVLRQNQVNGLQRVIESLDTVSPKDRDCTSLTFVGSRERLDSVRKELREVAQRICVSMNAEEKNDEVFLLSLSLIPMSRPLNPEKL